jgi:predicted RND superfamily exporter protein
MMIRFPGSSVNVDFAENVVYRAECLIGTRTGSDCADVARWPGAGTLPPEASLVLRVKDYHPEMRAETGGGVRSRVAETNALFRDVRASAIGSLISMTLIVLVAFRRIRALLYVMVPLLVGITMCLGAAAVLHGQLNVITAFTFAVLVGLGIDFGIHLGKRYEEKREGGLANEDAVARAFGSTGKAMALAMITTVLAFATLTSSRFRGFSQFGELCAIGVPLSMIAAYLLFPAIVTLADRVRPLRPRGPRLSAPPVVRRFASRPVGWILVAAIGLTTVAAALASQFLDFEYDYGKLGTKRPIWSRIDTRLATRGYTGSPAVALAETPEQAEAAYRQIKRHMRTDKLLRDAFSIWSFAPEHQERKVRVLTQMDVLMDDPSFGFFEDGLSDEDLDRLDEWRTYLRTGPVVPASAEFPAWAKQLFTELDGRSVGRILYLMPRKSLTDGVEAMRMQDAYETIRLPDGTTVPVAASGFVFADIVRHIKSDGSFVTSLALVGVFLVLFAAYRSLRRTLITIAPLVAGIAWLLGLMVLFRINMTFYSMVMVPVVIGTGIDAAIHLYSRYLELGPGSILTVLRRTGPPVILSAVTTMAGFGSLMFTSHRGLMSMGQVAALGLSTVLVATLIGLPAIVLAIEKRKPAVPRPEQAPAPESPADGPEDAAGAGAPKT